MIFESDHAMATDCLNDTTMSNEIKRLVSFDLLPLHEKHLSLKWAKRTYAYYHLFDDEIRTTSYSNDDDLLNWISFTKTLMKNIKIKGTEAGRREIVRLACHQYNLFLPNKKSDFRTPFQKPLNVREVVSVITDPVWYNDNKIYKQDIIHHLAYGITRKGNNLWLLEAEKEWMASFRVSYDFNDCKRITETRGFVYKLMNSTFSNSTIKMFKRAMLANLGEYISVRDNEGLIQKINSGTIKNLSYKHISFKNGKGLVITKRDFHSHDQNMSMKQLVNYVNEWVKMSIINGVELDQIVSNIQKMYNMNQDILKRKLVPHNCGFEPVLKRNKTNPIQVATLETEKDRNQISLHRK